MAPRHAADKATAMNQKGRPPPLPPRASSSQQTSYNDAPPPPYETSVNDTSYAEVRKAQRDPRSSSTDSLAPSDSNPQHDRRRLLLIYVHGFMGTELSFQSFPAHVHNLMTALAAETHVVHTKIYPTYRSKKNISFARDDFSRWYITHSLASNPC